jgi:hypothetical protein
MIAKLKGRSGSVAAVAIGGNGGDILSGQGALYSEHFTTILRPTPRFPSGGRRRGKG